MRFRFFLCASADLGVRRSKVEISFCRSGYIQVLREDSSRPLPCGGPLDCPDGGTARVVATLSLLVKLEVELQSKLHQTRIASLQHLAEGRVAEVPVRVHKLRFVEKVEDVGAELEISN